MTRTDRQKPTRFEPVRGRVLLRMPTVCLKTGLSRSTIYRLEGLGEFPRHIKLGANASAWDCAEIDDWISAREAATRAADAE